MAPALDLLHETKVLVSACLEDGKLDSGEILRIAIFVAETANKVSGLSGAEKKELVLKTVAQAVEEAVPAELREKVGSTVALQVLPTVLDIAVGAARGRLDLGLPKGSWAAKVAACWCAGVEAVKVVKAAVAAPKSPVSSVEPPAEVQQHVAEPVAEPAKESLPSPQEPPKQSATQESEVRSPEIPLPNTTQPTEFQTEPSPVASAEASPQPDQTSPAPDS